MKNVKFIARCGSTGMMHRLCPASVSAPRILVAYLILLSQVLLIHPVNSQAGNDAVIDAYNFRMEGDFQQARETLEGVLREDPKLAMAHYEMGRLLVSSDPFNTDGILDAFSMAMDLDPENAKYAFSWAKAAMLGAYVAMHQGDEDKVRSMVGESCKGFEQVLQLDPDCREALLYLVDIYAGVPEDAGGDRAKALDYQERLEQVDKLFAARGSLILGQEDGEKESDFWRNYLASNGASPEVHELLFLALLAEDDISGASAFYTEMRKSGEGPAEMQLQLARGHMMRVMQGRGDNVTDPEASKRYLLDYIDGDTNQPVCIKAWAYGQLAVISRVQKDDVGFKTYAEKAAAICPGFSRAFAAPKLENPPDNPQYDYSSFFRPF